MAHFPDDDLTPRSDPPPADERDGAAQHPPKRPTGDAEDTTPAFNPVDPESSWMAFLTPPAIDLDDDGIPDVQQAAPIAAPPAELDADATAAALGDQVQAWLASADDDPPVDPLAGLAAVQPVSPADSAADADPTAASQAVVSAETTTAEALVPLGGRVRVLERGTTDAVSAEPAPVPLMDDTSADAIPASASAAQPNFEDLTVAALLERLWRAPNATFDALVTVLQTDPPGRERRATKLAYAGAGTGGVRTAVPVVAPPRPAAVLIPPRDDEDRAAFDRAGLRKGLLIGAFILALIGTLIMQNGVNRSEADALFPALPFLGMALLAALAGELVGGVLRPDHKKDVELRPDAETERVPWGAVTIRLGIAALTVSAALLTLLFTTRNTFTLLGVLTWLVSIGGVVWTFAPAGWRPADVLRTIGSGLNALGRVKLANLTFLGLVAALAIGAYLRLIDLHLAPREMTSDHVEMILDVNRVLTGQTSVFFSNIGGREPLQFYLLALFSSVPGLGLTFNTQKLLTALEGVLLLPLLWWLGREVIGPRQPRLGNTTGVLMALLAAVGYWPLILSRLGERIALTPIFVALILIFLIRALRYGRRWDFILTGLFLGIGLYTYQVIRMLPVVIVIGVGMTMLIYLRNLRVRASLFENLAVTTLVAFVIFVPLFGYSLENPEEFWRRTSGRLFGDDLMQTTDAAGNIIYRSPTTEERLTALADNLPVLALNLRNAVLMYNWKGDVGWFQNYPNTPAFDPVTGGLLVVGLGAWIARMIKRRDGGDWLIVIGFGVLLLPSALALAYPIENPSFTRMSGTLPIVYLWTAYPLAVLLQRQANDGAGLRRIAPLVGMAAVVGVVMISLTVSNQRYFTLYSQNYQRQTFPYSDAGRFLTNFALSGPGYGNAFMIAYEYWWDHRAVGLEAGQVEWPNTIRTLDELPRTLQIAYLRTSGGPALNVNYEMLFFYNPLDTEAEARLLAWFPTGFSQDIATYQPEDSYRVFRAPALTEEGFNAFLLNAGITGVGS